MNLEELMQFMADPMRPPRDFGIMMSHLEHDQITAELNRMGWRKGKDACTRMVNYVGYELTLSLPKRRTEFYQIKHVKLV